MAPGKGEFEMEFDRRKQGFQQWLGGLDDSGVHAEIERIERELENLRMYGDLLSHALDLKRRSNAWFTSDAWQSWVCADDPKSIAEASVIEAPDGEGDVRAFDDSGTAVETPPLPLNSLAERLARERSEPRFRARKAAHPTRALEHSAELADTVEATEPAAPDDEPATTSLPVRAWLQTLKKPHRSDKSPDVPPEPPSLDLADPNRDDAAREDEPVEVGASEAYAAVASAPGEEVADVDSSWGPSPGSASVSSDEVDFAASS
jgi:hypothetical protein